MAASDVITTVLAAVILVYVARGIGRRPFVVFARRMTGSLPMRPLGSAPGAERWFAGGGVLVFVGLGVAALIARSVGYPISAVGMLLVSYTGVLVVLDHRGAARAFARRTWSDSGMSVPNPVLSMRFLGGVMIFMGIFGAVVIMTQVFAS
jgi:hypothetical protein